MWNELLGFCVKSTQYCKETLSINFLFMSGNESLAKKCPMIDRMVRVCSALTNLSPPIIPFD